MKYSNGDECPGNIKWPTVNNAENMPDGSAPTNIFELGFDSGHRYDKDSLMNYE